MPAESLLEYQISWEFGTELNLVLTGWFSQIKNKILPSADTVGRSSARSELILIPKFSILIIVEALIILSFWAFNNVSVLVVVDGCADAINVHPSKSRKGVRLFTTLGLAPK